ncbi:MAG: class I SAM-dependent methyltransferase [Chloroflexi bacterium]|nr:class I SAM-dependent methyltransferase [Chloroflexota bacterium]
MTEEYYSYIKEWFRKESRFYHILVDIPFSRLRDRVVDFAKTREGSKILDVATGTGGQAFAFAKKGYDVVGIDLSEDMVKVANKINRYENLKFKVADATSMPFENNHFDVSCISLGLHDMPLAIREKAVEEMARVTKPEGIIVIVDYALPKNKIGRLLIYHLSKSYETKYYPEFIDSDLKTLLRKYRIKIEKETPIMFGCGKISKWINEK